MTYACFIFIAPGQDATKKLWLLEDKGGVVVHGLEEVIVRSAAEIYAVRYDVGNKYEHG